MLPLEPADDCGNLVEGGRNASLTSANVEIGLLHYPILLKERRVVLLQ